MSAPILAIDNITARYGNIPVLHGVSVDVRPNEIVALIGANGAGKTTLMMTVFGRPRVRAGRILFQGRDISDLAAYDIARLGIAQSPEGRRIFARMTVYENLQMGAIIAREPDRFDQDLEHVCTLFPVLKARRDQRGGTLSGGEQQMLAIARALMGQPKLLMLDEPSLGLAPLIVKQIFAAIKELNRLGLPVFLVEQNAYHSLKLCHRGYVMANGRITLSGSGEELLGSDEVRSAYLDGGTAKGQKLGAAP